MKLIALRELRSLFLSPLAWSVFAVVQFLIALVFAIRVNLISQADVQSQLAEVASSFGITELIVNHVYSWAALLLLLVAPLLTMRSFSEERQQKTLALLFAAPIPRYHIVLGKFFALWIFFILLSLVISLMPLSLLIGGQLDMGQLLSCMMALILLMGAFCAIGIYISSLTHSPIIAAMFTFASLLVLWVIDWAGQTAQHNILFSYLSMTNHYQPLLQGRIYSDDILYFFFMMIFFLGLTIQRLYAERFH